MKNTIRLLTYSSLLLSLMACGTAMKAPMVDPAITVPNGHQLVMSALGSGELTYECKAKPAMPTVFEWSFVGPVASLTDKNGTLVGKYYGGPTWESNDGSKVTGKQVAVVPGNPGSIPLQLVKTNGGMGTGAMSDISYIQRLNTVGGIAPTETCSNDNLGAKKWSNTKLIIYSTSLTKPN